MGSKGWISEISCVVSRDVDNLLSRPFVVVSRTLTFLVQFFIFGYTVSTLVKGFDFYRYYGIGTVITTVCSVSYLIGHDLFQEAELGLLDYLLSLPVSRRTLIVGRSLGGAARSMAYGTPMFILAMLALGFRNPVDIVESLLALFALAFGISGLSITVAIAIRNEERFDILLAFIELFTVRFSTALYPWRAMPYYASAVSAFSPVTSAAQVIQSSLFNSTTDLAGWGNLLAFVFAFFAISSAFYYKRIEGGVYR
ncbi:MAG: ABC transporter permease [Candidatus Brockarchaeota archaeon]|nr:ABC transporter permease [Candidatus Brockarchaeota archaeon]